MTETTEKPSLRKGDTLWQSELKWLVVIPVDPPEDADGRPSWRVKARFSVKGEAAEYKQFIEIADPELDGCVYVFDARAIGAPYSGSWTLTDVEVNP